MSGHEHEHEAPSAECADFLDRIVYFLDNELDEADSSAVRIHLDACNPCLQQYDLQRTVKAIVARSCSEPAPREPSRTGPAADPRDPRRDHRDLSRPDFVWAPGFGRLGTARSMG